MTIETDNSTPRQYAEREAAAIEAVQIRARKMGADKYATAWGCLRTRNAIRAGESAYRAIEIGTSRMVEIMEGLDQ